MRTAYRTIATLSLMIGLWIVAGCGVRSEAAVRHAKIGAGYAVGEATTLTVMVGGAERTALVFRNSVPAPPSGAPLVLVFHGHGGTAQFMARRLRLQELWPQAIVAYLQGLPGVAGITDPEGRANGWQKNPGEMDDRDVRFTDVLLSELEKRHKVDARRVYAVGHSNGARFVNVLWVMRGDKFAAFCSASAQGGRLLERVKPRSIFMIAGERDPLVPYQGQLLSVGLARRVLHTEAARAVTSGYLTTEPGSNGIELATYLHPGGHEFPQAALPLVVEFFKRHALPTT
jgi:polyhydroxybutyrate depolymerase